MLINDPRQGEIYFANLPESGWRPVIIVSRDTLNRGNYLAVVGVTSKNFDRRRVLDNCVPFRAGEFGFTSDCVAQCETITNTHRRWFDPDPIGRLDTMTLRSVINAIGDVIAAECEPV
ncbi:MAG: type II toxin-antitoxin system PemK/MazF family toxin [Planctomycetota bacterium]